MLEFIRINPLFTAFVVVGIVLCVLIILWVAMEISRTSTAHKNSLEDEVRGLFGPGAIPGGYTGGVIRNNNQTVAAAIAGAICAASSAPPYNLQIRSFKKK
jgi:hypothetical protein